MTILTEIDDINRFANAEKFASFIGLIPMTSSSGEKQKVGEMTFRAQTFLRSIIIEASWIAIGRDPALLMAYQQLSKRMESNKAIVRIAKKYTNSGKQTTYKTYSISGNDRCRGLAAWTAIARLRHFLLIKAEKGYCGNTI